MGPILPAQPSGAEHSLTPDCSAQLPGHVVIMEVNIAKMTEEEDLVEGVANADDTMATRGKVSFARKIV